MKAKLNTITMTKNLRWDKGAKWFVARTRTIYFPLLMCNNLGFEIKFKKVWSKVALWRHDNYLKAGQNGPLLKQLLKNNVRIVYRVAGGKMLVLSPKRHERNGTIYRNRSTTWSHATHSQTPYPMLLFALSVKSSLRHYISRTRNNNINKELERNSMQSNNGAIICVWIVYLYIVQWTMLTSLFCILKNYYCGCCQLPAVCCRLPAACCLLSAACCLLPAVCCPPVIQFEPNS